MTTNTWTAYTAIGGTKVLVGNLNDVRRGVVRFGLGRVVAVNDATSEALSLDASGNVTEKDATAVAFLVENGFVERTHVCKRCGLIGDDCACEPSGQFE